MSGVEQKCTPLSTAVSRLVSFVLQEFGGHPLRSVVQQRLHALDEVAVRQHVSQWQEYYRNEDLLIDYAYELLPLYLESFGLHAELPELTQTQRLNLCNIIREIFAAMQH